MTYPAHDDETTAAVRRPDPAGPGRALQAPFGQRAAAQQPAPQAPLRRESLPPPPALPPPPMIGGTATHRGQSTWASQAASAVQAQAAPAVTAATPLAGSLAMSVAGDQDPPPGGAATAGATLDRRGPSGRMPRLHIGRHTVSRAALRGIGVSPTGSGLIIGIDRQHEPVPVRIFAPEPVRITLVGGVWAAQLITFRALGLGARVVVVTSDPPAWYGFGERATGHPHRVTVLAGEQPMALSGTSQRPVLVIYDLGVAGPATAPALGPWQTQFTILRQLDRPGVPALQESQLTLLQRLGGDEAALAESALRLRPHGGQFLQFMADDMIALIGDGADRYVWLAQTPIEQEQGGTARR
jgi:hypothetical protein